MFHKIYHTRSIVSRGWGLCLWIALGQFRFGNEYSYPIHAFHDVTIRIQTMWCHRAVVCSHNHNSIITAPSAHAEQMTMMLDNYRCKQFHGILNWENPSSGLRDTPPMKSGTVAHPPTAVRWYSSTPTIPCCMWQKIASFHESCEYLLCGYRWSPDTCWDPPQAAKQRHT